MTRQTTPCATEKEAVEKTNQLASELALELEANGKKGTIVMDVIFHPYAKWRKRWIGEVLVRFSA